LTPAQPVLYDARFPDDEVAMARVCELCGKKTTFGSNVSHAHNVTNRTWLPNLQQIRVLLENGAAKRMRVCTRCIRSGRVRKAVS